MGDGCGSSVIPFQKIERARAQQAKSAPFKALFDAVYAYLRVETTRRSPCATFPKPDKNRKA